MRISTFLFAIKQGFKNCVRNKLYSFVSIMTTAACLFLFGVFFAILLNVQHIVRNAQEGVCVTVFFTDEATAERKEEINSLIMNRVEVKDTYYVTADEAWAEFSQEYFGEEYVAGFTENPLEKSDNLQIYMNDVSMQSALVTYLNSLEGVRKVNESAITANMLTSMDSMVTYVAIAIIVLLLVVSAFIISNTVNLGISLRREEISIMKYLGATDFFVRAPFVVEGLILGLFGSVVPLVAIYFLYGQAMDFLVDNFFSLQSMLAFMPIEEVMGLLAPISIAVGVGIGFLGSFFTVRKHLRV